MTESPPHIISDLVIHRLVRAAAGASQLELRAAPNPPDDAAARLMERLCRHFAERPGKGYGAFERDERSFPMPALIRRHVIAQDLDFAGLSEAMMAHLQQRLDEDKVEDGGFVLVARATVFGADCLWFALIQDILGSAIVGELDIVDSPHLDLAGLRMAGRIDLSGWQQGAERYISFLKGRGDVAGWFKRFLGCSDVVLALKETQKLVQTLGDFADARQLEPAARDELLARAHGVLEDMGDSGAPVKLAELAAEIFPDAPEALGAVLQDQALALASGFVPDKRALRPLIRFKASGEDWKLEFDRSSLRSGSIQYDKTSNTLVLANIPDALKQLLLEE